MDEFNFETTKEPHWYTDPEADTVPVEVVKAKHLPQINDEPDSLYVRFYEGSLYPVSIKYCLGAFEFREDKKELPSY